MSNNEKPEKQLDAVLGYLCNEEEYQETHQQISERSNLNFTDKDLQLILDKLCKDGYVSFSFVKQKDKLTDIRTYYISFHGRLFLHRGGFQSESKTLKIKNRWTIVKTIAAALNAVSIIAIAIWSVIVSKESKIKDEQIVNLEATIDSLKKSIIKPSHTTFINSDTTKAK